jgi:hypothetical protein
MHNHVVFRLLLSIVAVLISFAAPAEASVQVKSASVLPATVSPGQTVNIQVSVQPSAAENDMLVDLELYNAAGTKVGQNYFQGQNFSAGQSVSYSWNYRVPAGAVFGTYTLKAGVFTAGWAADPYWNGSVASFAVATSAASSAQSGTGPAAQLAAKLGKPARLLVGLGTQGALDAISAIQSQALKPDIFEQYLVGAGSGDWTTWNSPRGYYVQMVAQRADAVGAVPMYTLYQMASNGDGNLSGLNSSTFMNGYWSNVRLLFQQIAAYGKPVLVNFEPDFWGYAQRQAANGDPSQLFAYVSANPDCSTLSNDIVGIAECLIDMARKYAPKAYVGFPPSTWGADSGAAVIAFMNAIGAQNADFIVEQTLDRDGGCFELSPQPSYCSRSGGGWYWDETNQTHPNFQDYLRAVETYHAGIGNLPVIWWQTPEGVPSSTPGGGDGHYRDNRVHYFLTHPAELTAVGGLGVVFSTGETHQTNITTDGGQFQSLDDAYLAAPVSLP